MYSVSRLRQEQVELREILLSLELSESEIKSFLAMLNSFFYCLAKSHRVVARGKKGFHEIAQNRLPVLLRLLKKQAANVIVPIKWLSEHIEKFWAGACHSDRFLRSVREKLSKVFGLFDFKPGTKGKRAVPVLRRFNLHRALALAEVLEVELIERFGERQQEAVIDEPIIGTGDITDAILEASGCDADDFSALPSHRGYFTAMLFNVIFAGVARWRRTDEGIGLSMLVDEVLGLSVIVSSNDEENEVYPVCQGTGLIDRDYGTSVDPNRFPPTF